MSEEVAGGSDLALTLQWNAADTVPGFEPTRARLKHYTGGAWDEHTAAAEWGAVTAAVTQAMTRTHITSFSLFGVVAAAPLPVKFTAFDAQASGTAALCT